MRKVILLLFLEIFICLPVQSQEKPKKVVFILLDGISYDVVRQVETPHIDRISSAGGFTKAYVGGERGTYSESPTISAVGYNSLLTGTWVNKHNVFGNNIRRPNYHYWTVFRYLRESRPDAHLAIFSTWLDNRTKLIGEGLEETGNLKMDYAFDGFELDTLAFPHDKEKRYIFEIDEWVSQEAARYILEHGPDLSWVYLQYPDDMGHQYGDSPQLFEAVREADKQTGGIYDSVLKRMEMGENWLIVVTTDHGRQPTTGLHHGGQSDREREIWVATNTPYLNDYFKHELIALVDVLPTMLRYLNIQVPEANLSEIDGVPLTGPISIYQPSIENIADQLVFSWSFCGEIDEEIEIWAAYGNRFRTTGEADDYELLGKVKGSQETFSFPINQVEKEQMKVLFKGQHNMVNKWLVKPKTP
jgi:hypothetical protein